MTDFERITVTLTVSVGVGWMVGMLAFWVWLATRDGIDWE